MRASCSARAFTALCCISVLVAIASVRAGNFLSSERRWIEGGDGRHNPIRPVEAVDFDAAPSTPMTYAERESARGDRIVDMVKSSEAFLPSALQELHGGSRPVRDAFSAHLTGHVQARLYAGGSHASNFYHTIVRPKMWDFTTQHLTPILRRRVVELSEEIVNNNEADARTIKHRIMAELPTFEAHDRAMQFAVDQEVEAARRAAFARRDPHPEAAVARRLSMVTDWRLKRPEYDDMVQFVDHTVNGILSAGSTHNPVESLFNHLHIL